MAADRPTPKGVLCNAGAGAAAGKIFKRVYFYFFYFLRKIYNPVFPLLSICLNVYMDMIQGFALIWEINMLQE